MENLVQENWKILETGLMLGLLNTMPSDWVDAEPTEWKIKVPKTFIENTMEALMKFDTMDLELAEEIIETFLSMLLIRGVQSKIIAEGAQSIKSAADVKTMVDSVKLS